MNKELQAIIDDSKNIPLLHEVLLQTKKLPEATQARIVADYKAALAKRDAKLLENQEKKK